jgi:hypothetical protein
MVRTARSWGALAALAATVLCVLSSSAHGAANSASQLPQPGALNGVSCVATADCWAVGASQDNDNQQSSETFHWTGTTWSPVSSPVGNLQSVSCASAHACIAVGSIGDGGKSAPRPLTMRWNGSTWASQATPKLPDAGVFSVSCPSAASCWAVGELARGQRSLALHWNGNSWKQAKSPDPGGKHGSQLQSVSCVTASNCWALGTFYAPPLKPTIATYIFALHWNGTSWRTQWTSAAYPGSDASATIPMHVACASADECWAGGDESEGPLYNSLVLIRWDGREWTPVRPPKVGSASINGIACSSSRQCFAVGSTGSFGTGTHSLILRWDGSRWARAAAPSAKGALSDVSCGARNLSSRVRQLGRGFSGQAPRSRAC